MRVPRYLAQSACGKIYPFSVIGEVLTRHFVNFTYTDFGSIILIVHILEQLLILCRCSCRNLADALGFVCVTIIVSSTANDTVAMFLFVGKSAVNCG